MGVRDAEDRVAAGELPGRPSGKGGPGGSGDDDPGSWGLSRALSAACRTEGPGAARRW